MPKKKGGAGKSRPLMKKASIQKRTVAKPIQKTKVVQKKTKSSKVKKTSR